MNAVDTDILIYAHDPRDSTKQAIASSLLASLSDGVLLWQVACEYLAASRKLEPFGYKSEQAWQDVEDMRDAWHTILPAWGTMDREKQLLKKYALSHWDALIIAACLENGVDRLYSEDFDAYSIVDGFVIVNPFAS